MLNKLQLWLKKLWKLHNAKEDNNLTIKQAWKTVYVIIGREDNKAPSRIRIDGHIVNNLKVLANSFNKIFQDKVKKLRNQTNDRPKVSSTDRSKAWIDSKATIIRKFSLKVINVTKVRQVLKKMKPSRSHGIDCIDAHSIKIAAPLIEEAVLHLVNLSISTGCFATFWKLNLCFHYLKRTIY